MSDFQKGDVVRRIAGSYAMVSGRAMKVGDTDRIIDISPHARDLHLSAFGKGHASRNFELVSRAVQPPAMLLPSDPAVRKDLPITSGVLDYFPLAIAEVARVSKAGNDQHNPGQPLHWDKTKSLDHADCIPRHLIDRTARDTDGMRHSAKLAWRALALLETQLEAERDAERG